MTDPSGIDLRGHFRNVVVCDDIRDEIGNKKSLMGILAGDIIADTIPANIQIALYVDYVPTSNEGHDQLAFRLLQDETEIAKGAISIDNAAVKFPNFVLPKALVRFERACIFRIVCSVNGSEEVELARKSITARSGD